MGCLLSAKSVLSSSSLLVPCPHHQAGAAIELLLVLQSPLLAVLPKEGKLLVFDRYFGCLTVLDSQLFLLELGQLQPKLLIHCSSLSLNKLLVRGIYGLVGRYDSIQILLGERKLASGEGLGIREGFCCVPLVLVRNHLLDRHLAISKVLVSSQILLQSRQSRLVLLSLQGGVDARKLLFTSRYCFLCSGYSSRISCLLSSIEDFLGCDYLLSCLGPPA